jgi:hypothetical protein
VNFKFPGSTGTDPGNPFTTTFSLTVSSTAQLDCRPLPVSRAAGRAWVDHQDAAEPLCQMVAPVAV